MVSDYADGVQFSFSTESLLKVPVQMHLTTSASRKIYVETVECSVIKLHYV